ncbi:MAG: lactonase family protein [Clostridium sp.]|uniref:lactonase family protein n=1 Tax=Clostridium sp. TaxID=1506 RepID=UPI003EE7DF56
MDSHFLIGTYTKKYSKGLYFLTIDEKGEGFFTKAFHLNNPTYLDVCNNLLVSSHGDKHSGGVVLFKLENETLIPLDKSDNFSCSPCFVSLYKDFILASNYHDGLFILYKINPDFSLAIVKKINILNSHLHYSSVYNNKLFLVDMNNSDIYIYDFNSLDLIKTLSLDKNSKPRHLVFKDNFMYVLTEGSNNIILIDINTFEILKEYSPLGDSEIFEASAIHIHNGILYTAERKTNTISIFKILEDDTLSLIQNFNHPSINVPRDFGVSKNNRLICCNSLKDSLSVFILNKDGSINNFLNEIPLPEPVCIKEI